MGLIEALCSGQVLLPHSGGRRHVLGGLVMARLAVQVVDVCDVCHGLLLVAG